MREKLAYTLLALFVVTLAVSSMLLADRVTDLEARLENAVRLQSH